MNCNFHHDDMLTISRLAGKPEKQKESTFLATEAGDSLERYVDSISMGKEAWEGREVGRCVCPHLQLCQEILRNLKVNLCLST